MQKEVEYTLVDIKKTKNTDRLLCLTVDSPTHEFLVTKSDIPTHNSDEAKEAQAMKDECLICIGSIARLGRAAGVHLVIATQRPDTKIIPGEIRANLTTRAGCGVLTSAASIMAFEDNSGMRIPSKVKGGVRIAIHGKGQMGQGFFADDTWLERYFEKFGGYEKWLEQQDLNADAKSSYSQLEDAIENLEEKEAQANPMNDWNEDMDEIFNLK